MKKVIVIGAGIAGLNAGIELLQHGYEVHLYEKNENVGGLCYGFFKDGYNIDTCLHWLMGTKKGTILNELWYNNGALSDEVKISNLPNFASFIYKDVVVSFSRNLDEEENRWLELSPKDSRVIKNFFDCVRSLAKVWDHTQKVGSKKVTMDILKTLPNFGKILVAMTSSRSKYAKKLTNPALSFAIKNAMTGYNSVFFFMLVYGLFSTGDGNVPLGGAYYMVNRIKDKFLSLGGKLYLNKEVNEIIVEDNSVKGILVDNTKIESDYVISTVDVNYTLKHLLKDKYQSLTYNFLNKNINKYTISSCFCIYLKVKDYKDDIATPTCIKINKVKVGIHQIDALLIRPYSFDTTFKYQDEAVLSLFVDQNQDDYLFYTNLKDYKQEKERIIDDLVKAFVSEYPQYIDKVEVLTSFSPIELHKQTNTSYGSIQSYSLTDKGMFYSFKGKINKLPNLYMCGQWNRSMGGTPTALLTSHEVVKKILRKDKKKG